MRWLRVWGLRQLKLGLATATRVVFACAAGRFAGGEAWATCTGLAGRETWRAGAFATWTIACLRIVGLGLAAGEALANRAGLALVALGLGFGGEALASCAGLAWRKVGVD